MSYITKDDLRSWVNLSDNVVGDDDRLTSAADAANAAVNLYCRRTFDVAPTDADPTTRNYTSLTIDDLGSLDGLLVEVSNDRATWTTVASSKYWLGPEGVETDFPARPWYVINPIEAVQVRDGFYETGYPNFGYQPSPFAIAQFVRVTSAFWGWPGTTVHPSVFQAALLMGAWLYARSSSPFAMIGADIPVRIARAGDPDVCHLLDPLRRTSRTIGV